MPLLLFIVAVAPISPAELLAKIREAQSWHDHVRMSIHNVADEKLTNRVFEYNINYRHSEQGISWTGSRTAARSGEDAFFMVFDGVYALNTPLTSVYAEKEKDDAYATGSITRHESPQPVPLAANETGSAMWGYDPAMENKHICDVLAAAESLSIDYKQINGESCPVLLADTMYGHIELAVSPEKGYHPIELHINVKGEQRIGTRSAKSEGVEWDLTDTFSEFTRIDGTWVPTKCSAQDKIIFLSGKEPVTCTEEIKLSNIELNPVFDDKTFTLGIMPDGTNLTDGDFGIEYFLKDGKLDPYVDHYSEVQELHYEIAALVEPARPTDAAPHSAGPVTPQTSTEALRTNRLRLVASSVAAVAIVSLAGALAVRWRGKRKTDGAPPND